MRDDGGGGGTILIDPTSLRRCASTLDTLASDLTSTASCLRGTGLPTMPAPVAGRVASGIQDVAGILSTFSSLHDAAAELKARATWADVANALASGYPLGGSVLREFVRGLEDGSLMRYASGEDRRRAGAWVGGAYRQTFGRDPAKLVELATILRGSGYDPDFAEAFVRSFGGDYLVRVPRAIQAMEWPAALMQSTSPFADRRLALDLQYGGYELKDDPESLLSGFVMTLAVATSAADTSRRSSRLQDAEDEIAQSDDHWAVTQLLQNGPPAGRRFLGQVFLHQVIPLVRQDTTTAMIGGMPTVEYPIGDLQGDPKEVLLHAIARNGAASADVLTTRLPEKVFFQTPYGPVESDDPVTILYNGHWRDDGAAFGGVYTAATDHLQPVGDAAGTDASGNGLTWKLIDQVLHGGGAHPDALTDALARDVTTHHLPALFESAGQGGYEASGTQLDDGRLYVSGHDMRELFQQLADDPERDGKFLNGFAHYQAQFIAQNAHDHPGDAYAWGYKVGAVNQYLLNAHDVDAAIDYRHASEQQRLLFGAIHQTIGLLTEANPPLHVAVEYTAPLFEHVGAPDADAVGQQLYDGKLQTGATVRAMLASGFYGAGHLQDGPGAPPRELLSGGRLPDYGALHPHGGHDPRLTFDSWALDATGHDEAYRWAVNGASDGLAGREESVPLGG